MNKKLLSVVMSGAMLASACPAGVSAAETKGIKGSVVNAVKFVKNHKSSVIGGAILSIAAIGGPIAWLVYHNRDIVLYFNDPVFGTYLKNSLTLPANRVVVKGVKDKEEFKNKLNDAKGKNVEYDEDGLNDLNGEDKKTVIITKKVEKGQIKLTFEVKVEAEKKEEKENTNTESLEAEKKEEKEDETSKQSGNGSEESSTEENEDGSQAGSESETN